MEDSILKSTKKILNIPVDYDAFDLDVMTHINAALSTAAQLGVGDGTTIVESDAETWSSLGLPLHILSMLKSYVYLKTRILFDPPTTSFVLDASKQQIAEFESRMNVAREEIAHPYVAPTPTPVEEVVW